MSQCFCIAVLASFKMKLLAACLIFFRLISIALGDVNFEKLPGKVNRYLETKILSPDLKSTVEQLRQRKVIKPYIKNFDMKLLDNKDATQIRSITCDLCKAGVNILFSWADNGDTRDEIVEKFVDICITLNFATPKMCRGLIDTTIDDGLWIYSTKNSTEYPVTAQDVCGFNFFPDCWVGGPQYEWTLDLDFLGPKPAPITPQLPEPNAPTMKVLQLTDIHIDPNYLPGGNAECEDHSCCRVDQGEPVNASAAAGYWGDYRDCDTPYHAFENMLQQATSHEDLAYIIFTGDIIDHGRWATTIDSNRNTIIYAMTAMLNAFPSVKILPIFGNHEPHPTHNFVSDLPEIPSDVSTSWLYSLADYIWSAWIPNSSETILKGGFYSIDINAGLKVVALNNIFCYNYNWWLLYENKDPGGQLMWLAQELLKAEQQNQKVHILAHIPGNADCMPNWQKEYVRILDRFENTVVAQFHGHTHFEHVNVYYDPNDRARATQVGFIGGSGTAYSDVNPNYRIYIIDGEYAESSYRVLDHETWSFNLTEANMAGPDVLPNWQKLYSFRETFGLDSLLPQDLDGFVKRLAIDTELQDLYYRYYWTAGDPAMATPCDDDCRRNLICEIVRTVQGDDSKCDEILQ